MHNTDTYNLSKRLRNISNEPWALGNSILYDLCKNHPKHKTDEEIAAKIWLIGRAYAASIERRKNKTNINDDFYTDIVIPKIKHSDIDKWLNECEKTKEKELCLAVHKKVTNLFKSISGLEKRSLASKYLHFHLPQQFFIYDSRAVSSIKYLLRDLKLEKTRIEIDESNSDKEYALFYSKCILVRDAIQKQYKIFLSTRQLDSLLIDTGNRNLRK